MKNLALPQFLARAWLSPEGGFLYVPSQKCGCTTVMRTLLGIERLQGRTSLDPETLSGSSLHNDTGLAVGVQGNVADALDSVLAFSVVRNPYTRALSAFLDKIRPGFDPFVTRQFERRFDCRAADVGFRDFLGCLRSEVPERLNPHWRPSFMNLGIGEMRYDYIAKLEDMDSLFTEVFQRLHPGLEGVRSYISHARGAGAKLREFYDEDCIALVNEIYAADFDTFGYRRNDFEILQGEAVDVERCAAMAGGRHFGFAAPEQCRLTFQARAHIEAGELQAAEAVLRRLLALGHEPPGACLQLAGILTRRNEPHAAVQLLQQACNRHAESPLLFLELGRLLREAERLPEAEAALERAAALAPDLPGPLLQQCQLCLARNEDARAMELVQQALRRNDANPVCHALHGELLARAGELEAAVAALERAVELAPDKATHHNKLSHLLARQGRLDEALERVRRAIELDPAHTRFRLHLANVFEAKGELEAARTALDAALHLAPQDATIRKRRRELKRLRCMRKWLGWLRRG